ncbi:MAG: hypothetical protein ACK4YF_08490, partial [Exilispira sp.]
TSVNNNLKFILARINAAGNVTNAEPNALEERSFPIELSVKDRDLQYRLKRRPIRFTPIPKRRFPIINNLTSFEEEEIAILYSKIAFFVRFFINSV